MAARSGTSEEQRHDARGGLLKSFRALLVSAWPERTSMETLLDDAGVKSEKYIGTADMPDDRWHQTLKKLDGDGKLLMLADQVRGRFDDPQEAVERLVAFERSRLQDAELGRQAATVEVFNRIVEKLGSAASYVRKLQREPVNADLKDLAALKDYLADLYKLLDELQEAQRAAPSRHDEIAHASEIERCMNRCVDAIQLYRALLLYQQPPDDLSQFSAVQPHGGMSDRAKDELVLLNAKAWLRNALNRLIEAGESS